MFNVKDYRSKTFLVKFNKPLIFVVTEFLNDCYFALMQKNQKIKTVRKNLEIQRCTSLKFLNSSRLAGTQTRLAAGQPKIISNVRCAGISNNFS